MRFLATTFTLCLVFLPAITVSANSDLSLCTLRSAHVPANDVAFKPGVDVRGNAVVPADIQGSFTNAVPEIIRIPITIDFTNQLNLNLPEGTELDSNFGVIEVHKNGKTVYNGIDVTDRAAAVCDDNPETVAKEATLDVRELKIIEVEELEDPTSLKPSDVVVVEEGAADTEEIEKAPKKDTKIIITEDGDIIYGEDY